MRRKVSIIEFLYISICVFIFAGAANRKMTYISLIVTIVFSIILANISVKTKSVNICKGVLFLLIMQNLCIGLGAHIARNTDSSLKLLTQIPFLTTAVLWVLTCAIQKWRVENESLRVCFVALIVCIVISFFISRGSIQAMAISVRNMTVFYMAYEIGSRNINTEEKKDDFIQFFVKSGLVLCVIGIIILFGGYSVYKFLGIHEVYIAKAAAFTEGGMDGRFYTSLFSQKSYVRMGSLYYEPVNLAYYLSMCFLCALYKNPWKNNAVMKITSIIFLGVGLFLTFGKGGYIIATGTIGCVFAEKILKKIKGHIGVPIVIVIGAGVIMVAFCIYYVNNVGLAVLNHIWGVQLTWKNVLKQPYGYGLGTGGNAAQVLGSLSDAWLATGGETALMSFMYQIGVQGVLFFVLNFIYMSKTQTTSKSDFERMFFYIPYILIAISLLQDNTFTPQCIIPFMLLQGAHTANKKISVKEYKNEKNQNYPELFTEQYLN